MNKSLHTPSQAISETISVIWPFDASAPLSTSSAVIERNRTTPTAAKSALKLPKCPKQGKILIQSQNTIKI